MITNDVEHRFMCLLSIHMFYFMKNLLNLLIFVYVKVCVHIKTCTKFSIEVLTTIAWKKKVKLKSLSHVQLCNLMDCSLTGSSIYGIFQARILEWVAISFSRRSSRPRDWTQVSCISGRLFTTWGTRKSLQLHTITQT